MDGAISMAQTALPLLALRLMADSWFLGMLSWVAQAVRLPFCLFTGRISERTGRMPVIASALLLFVASALVMSFAGSLKALLASQILMLISVGAFYPSLQALIADRSPKGQLTGNIGAFNLGWCLGSALCSLAAGYLLQVYARLPFWAAAAMGVCILLVLLSWQSSHSAAREAAKSEETFAPADPNLLLVARMGHFLAMFGLTTCRTLFPQLARQYCSEGVVGVLIAILVSGQTVSMVLAGAGPWWRGRFWPILASQGLICLGAIGVLMGQGAPAFAISLFAVGSGLGISYTGSLYYGLQARSRSGHNAGIHESLVAAAGISAGLIGGATAQWIGIRAPYVTMSILAAVMMLSSVLIGAFRPIKVNPR